MPDSGNRPPQNTDLASHVRNPAPDWLRPEGVSLGTWEHVHSRQAALTFDAHVRDCPWATWDLAVARTLIDQARDPLVVDFGCETGRTIDVIGRDAWMVARLPLDLNSHHACHSRIAFGFDRRIP